MQAQTLLLVDADGDCEDVVAQAARGANYKMLFAKTSAAAFEIIRQQVRRLDLVIIDIDPGAHGIALLEAMTACAERPPIIVVSALEEVYMRPIAVGHGAASCLGKPLRLPRLLAALRDVAIHRGLTCNRWGSVIPAPAREPVNGRRQFRGIAAKLSPSRKDRTTKSRK